MRLPHAVDRRETFVLPAQLGDDLGVATLDDPPEPCGVFGRQRIACDRLVVDPQRLVRENRRAAATHHVVRELADDFFDRHIEIFAVDLAERRALGRAEHFAVFTVRLLPLLLRAVDREADKEDLPFGLEGGVTGAELGDGIGFIGEVATREILGQRDAELRLRRGLEEGIDVGRPLIQGRQDRTDVPPVVEARGIVLGFHVFIGFEQEESGQLVGECRCLFHCNFKYRVSCSGVVLSAICGVYRSRPRHSAAQFRAAEATNCKITRPSGEKSPDRNYRFPHLAASRAGRQRPPSAPPHDRCGGDDVPVLVSYGSRGPYGKGSDIAEPKTFT